MASVKMIFENQYTCKVIVMTVREISALVLLTR